MFYWRFQYRWLVTWSSYYSRRTRYHPRLWPCPVRRYHRRLRLFLRRRRCSRRPCRRACRWVCLRSISWCPWRGVEPRYSSILVQGWCPGWSWWRTPWWMLIFRGRSRVSWGDLWVIARWGRPFKFIWWDPSCWGRWGCYWRRFVCRGAHVIWFGAWVRPLRIPPGCLRPSWLHR